MGEWKLLAQILSPLAGQTFYNHKIVLPLNKLVLLKQIKFLLKSVLLAPRPTYICL